MRYLLLALAWTAYCTLHSAMISETATGFLKRRLGDSFRFYRLSGGTWTLVTARDVVIDSLGKAATTFKFTSGGSWYVRSIANPTPSYNANSVWSPLERYNVR